MSDPDDAFFEQLGHLVDAAQDGRAADSDVAYDDASRRAGEAAAALQEMDREGW
ncbi:hypothetical protein P3T27_007250 [Kitasatospora sp. MAA19]|uniref:hypothetical protein n=1 Tax=Kitasatospora sp. MAA19 TaxID=3035090 RepID=UPI0024761719|nr:hypothetical protein [Kitasatospora sp. MAA19]MDH6710500.1 hypothetical protein [Kitasatospora sp. MAA19]